MSEEKARSQKLKGEILPELPITYFISPKVAECLDRNGISHFQWILFLKIYHENTTGMSVLGKSYLGGMKDVLWIMVNRKARTQPEAKKDYDILERDVYTFIEKTQEDIQ